MCSARQDIKKKKKILLWKHLGISNWEWYQHNPSTQGKKFTTQSENRSNIPNIQIPRQISANHATFAKPWTTNRTNLCPKSCTQIHKHLYSHTRYQLQEPRVVSQDCCCHLGCHPTSFCEGPQPTERPWQLPVEGSTKHKVIKYDQKIWKSFWLCRCSAFVSALAFKLDRTAAWFTWEQAEADER